MKEYLNITEFEMNRGLRFGS